MKISTRYLSIFLASIISTINNVVVSGFAFSIINNNKDRMTKHSHSLSSSSLLSSSTSSESCGCDTITSGKISEKALTLNAQEILSKNGYVYNIDGERTSMKSLLSTSPSGVSIVVFLRSFGWPFCQELILQYGNIREERLLAKGIKLIMVSIGKPEVGKELCSHLGLKDADTYIYADPDNSTYNDLDLNKGIEQTFFNPATPFAIRDRLFKKDGMKELIQVLGKWSDAFYIPPKSDQVFNQGGTFIFKNEDTIFSHYDQATGAHADMDYVIQLASDNSDIIDASF